MADATTPNRGYTIPATGADVGTWGPIINANFTAMDNNISATNVINVAGNTDVTLSSTQYANLVQNCTGVLTGSINLVFPALAGFWVVENASTGAFSLTAKSAGGGTTAVVPQGFNQIVYGDGTNIISIGPAVKSNNTLIALAGSSSGYTTFQGQASGTNVLTFPGGTANIAASNHTTQRLTATSTATYTAAANAKTLWIRQWGGGGGGASTGTSGLGAGTAGGVTIFNGVNANGGTQGNSGLGIGGLGGQSGTGATSFRLPGFPGGAAGFVFQSGTSGSMFGGLGGGNGGGISASTTGSAAVANSGGGGGGAGLSNVSTLTIGGYNFAGGGGSGEYAEQVILSTASTYTYIVGTGGGGGSAGSAGSAGGSGGSGLIEVDEFY